MQTTEVATDHDPIGTSRTALSVFALALGREQHR
jgi:hypothetical protein